MNAIGVIALSLLLSCSCFSQNRYDVVIDEIMADPTPQVGLANTEWIELKNTSLVPVNLQGWRIGDGAGQSGAMPAFILQPDSFVIVCTGSGAAAMSSFGATISVTSFPSLDNNADQVFLRSASGRAIHAVAYSSSWYKNELKKDGGWSLEMIDTKSPCAGSSNWKASIHPQGGTPGHTNSVDAINSDQEAPRLRYAYTTDSVSIIAVFDEPVDSLAGASSSNYGIDGGISISAATTLGPLFNTVLLTLRNPLTTNTIYTITANNVTDCKNNAIATSNKARVGLPTEALPLDIVINEILFHPKSNGYDYVEFYNRGDRVFDASKFYVANRSNTNVIGSIKQVFPTPFYIFPGDYFVVTEDASSLEMNYLVKNSDAVLVLPSLPSYPDDEGDVLLLNGQAAVVDEVKYKDDWHFKLIANTEGVSLERIDPAGPSQEASNWHSAASTAGYGTPTYQNSQFKQTQVIDAVLEIQPKIFSPDNDGHDDVATIQYKAVAPGYVANITIFDAQGRPTRYLVKNGTLGISGQWNWDGLDEKGNKLPIGTYIVYSEIFNLQGKKKQFKNTLVLARKLN